MIYEFELNRAKNSARPEAKEKFYYHHSGSSGKWMVEDGKSMFTLVGRLKENEN